MNSIGCPDVMAAVELEQNQKRDEDARNTSYVGCYEKILSGSADVVVEVVDVNVHRKEDSGEDHHDVVAHQLLGNGVVQSWRSGRCGIELAEWVNEKL